MTFLGILRKKDKQIEDLEKKIEHLEWLADFQKNRIDNLTMQVHYSWERLTNENKRKVQDKYNLYVESK